MSQTEIKSFNGIVNTQPPSRLKPGDLVKCDNYLLSNDGSLLSRPGSLQKVAGMVHSLWSDDSGDLLLYRQNDNLYSYLSDGSSQLIRSGLLGTNPMSYAAVAGVVYYCDGLNNGVIEQGVNRTWGLPVPTFSATAGSGFLLKGYYRVTLSYLRDDGQQSGTIVPIEVNIPSDNWGIEINDITYPNDPTVVGIVVYVSTRDGKDLYHYGGYIPRGVPFYGIPQISNGQLHELLTLSMLEPPPIGTIVREFGGRLYIAVGNYLYYTEIYSAEMINPYNFLPFEHPITMIAPYNQGILVGTTNATYMLQGMSPEPQPFLRTMTAPYGVIKGTAAYVSIKHENGQNGWLWASTRGVCFSNEDGLLLNLTEKRFQYPYPDSLEGAGIVFYHDGFATYVVTLQGYDTEAFNIYMSDVVGDVKVEKIQTIPAGSGAAVLPVLTI